MIKELWISVKQMEDSELKLMIDEFKKNDSEISLEERIKIYFGLIKMNYIDRALFQMEIIYNEIKESGLMAEFAEQISDLKTYLMSEYKVEKDGHGGYNVRPRDGCDDCCDCCDCCFTEECLYCGVCCGLYFGFFICLGLCFGPEVMISVQDSVCNFICDTNPCCNCNCVRGGDGGIVGKGCGYCCESICENCCGCW